MLNTELVLCPLPVFFQVDVRVLMLWVVFCAGGVAGEARGMHTVSIARLVDDRWAVVSRYRYLVRPVPDLNRQMFTKSLFKSFLILAIFLGGGFYVAYIKGVDVGHMVSRLSEFDVSAPLKEEVNVQTVLPPQRLEENSAGPPGTTRVYKWRDKRGQWHYSQARPPSDAVTVSSMDVGHEPNVTSAYAETGNTEKTIKEQAATTTEKELSESGIPVSSYSRVAIRKLFEDAKDVERKLEERHESQQELLTNQ